MARLLAGLPKAFEDLSEDHWPQAAAAIMTTDTRPKGAAVQFEFEGETITVCGIAKGSGMIKPNMATMLGYIATNANVSQPLLNHQKSRRPVPQPHYRGRRYLHQRRLHADCHRPDGTAGNQQHPG